MYTVQYSISSNSVSILKTATVRFSGNSSSDDLSPPADEQPAPILAAAFVILKLQHHNYIQSNTSEHFRPFISKSSTPPQPSRLQIQSKQVTSITF